MTLEQSRHARAVLEACSIDPATDFFALSSGKVESLLRWAEYDGYRAPKHANGSRARYYYTMLQRRAGRAES